MSRRPGPAAGLERRGRSRLVAAALTALALLAVRPVTAQELVVSAAISLRDAMAEVARLFAERRAGIGVRYSLGASGELQKQIEAGAPVDVFVAAAQRQMDELQARGLVDAATRRVFARNSLAVVEPADSALDLAGPADLLGPRITRIVIGNPRTVPAGQYAEESLRALGLWERLRPKLVLAENVRQALDYVARGEVEAGFVYATDARLRPGRVREAFRPPEDSYRPVLYPVAVVTGTRHREAARRFVELLLSPQGQAVLARHGFLPPPPDRP